MKTFSLLLGLCLTSSIFAQSSLLTSETGWSKLTALPNNSDSYFYAFFEKSNEYSLGIKDGQNQGGHKTMTLTDTSNPEDNKQLIWSLPTTNGERNIVNASYPEYFFQTEWNASWSWRCSDNGGGNNSWGWINIEYTDGQGWKMQQDKYESYIGPWNVSIVKDDEFAGNRSQDEAPYFDVYQITKGKYIAAAEKLALATSDAPIDLSYAITNHTATFRNLTGWTQEFTEPRSNGYTFQTMSNNDQVPTVNTYFFESWQASGNLSNRSMTQTLIDMPAGTYRLSILTNCSVSGAYLILGDQQVALNEKEDNRASLELTLSTAGSLILGVKLEDYQSNWVTFDDFKLEYIGANQSAVRIALKEVIDQANAVTNPTDALKAAIQSATSIYNNTNSTSEALQNSIVALTNAIAKNTLDQASTTNPIDYIGKILNPSFEDGFNHWTQEGMQTQSNDGGDLPKDGNLYVEKWAPAPGPVADCQVIQTVENLPMGKYRLTAAAHNINQNNTSAVCTGAYLVANIDKSTINKDQDYTFVFTNIENAIDLGFVVEDATGNWVACDNFRLEYCGWDADAFNTQMNNYISTANKLLSSRMHGDLLTELRSALTAARAEFAARDTADYPTVSRTLRLATQKAQKSIAAYAALAQAISSANANYNSALGGAETYKQAIDAAQALYDGNASNEDLYTEIAKLERAALAYDTSHGTGAVPSVTTDTRYARGAVRAFGRCTINTNGATLKTSGFAYATHHDPTITDGYSTRTFENNGTIYVMEDLQPSTKYYVRPFAITTSNQIAYGDELKIITLPRGEMGWSYNNGGSQEENDRINAAIKYGMEIWNELMSVKGFWLTANYGSGTPTADCSYGGWMRIGPSASYQRTGTIMHEATHGVGVGTQGVWWNTELHNGLWYGERANAVLRFWDNDNNTSMQGDNMHMWPYGINGAHEDNGSDQLYYANALIVQGLHEDGLSPTSGCFASAAYTFDQEDDIKYYIKNESESGGLYTSYLTISDEGQLTWNTMSAIEVNQHDKYAWNLTFDPVTQMYQIRNVESGKYISYNDGFTTSAAADNLQLMRSRVATELDSFESRGYWILHSHGGWASALGASAQGTTSSPGFDISNAARTQRWLILTAEENTTLEVALKDRAEDLLTQAIAKVRALEAVPHTENVSGSQTTLEDQLTDIAARGANSNITSSELNVLIAEVYADGLQFVSKCKATDAPFDLTFLITDASLDSGEGWSEKPTIYNSAAEYYQKGFDLYQTIYNLPAGDYKVTCQAFERPGETNDIYTKYNDNTCGSYTQLYAGNLYTQVANIFDGQQSSSINAGNEVTPDNSSIFVPNDMTSGSAYFAEGLYQNEVNLTLTESEQDLTIGIRGTATWAYAWVMFDNFHLYYYGNDEVVGDVDLNGRIDIADVTMLVDIILGKGPETHGNADIDYNSTINIADVTKLVDIILGR